MDHHNLIRNIFRRKTAPFLQFKPILDEAFSEYEKNTGNDLLNNWLAKELQGCNTVEEVLAIIQDEANAFDKFRDGDKDKTLMKWIGPSLRVAYKISSIVGSDALSVRIIYDDLRRLRHSRVGESSCALSCESNLKWDWSSA